MTFCYILNNLHGFRHEMSSQRHAMRWKSAAGILCLAALFQGLILVWMHCCCGDSGFKTCSCTAETASPSNPEHPRLSDVSDCSCTLHLISASQQPIPIPKNFVLEQASPGHFPAISSSPILALEGAPPLWKSPAFPETPADRGRSQAFLCVFRC